MALVGRLNPESPWRRPRLRPTCSFPTSISDLKHPEYEVRGYTANLSGIEGLCQRKPAPVADRAVVRGWADSADRLREPLELASGAGGRAEQGICHAQRALGAGRGRLVRQLLTESLMLSVAGAVLGLGIAFGVTAYLAHQGSIALPLLSSVRIDGAALAWTLLIAVAAAVFFGLAPALRISSGNLQESLKDSGHGTSAGGSMKGCARCW